VRVSPNAPSRNPMVILKRTFIKQEIKTLDNSTELSGNTFSGYLSNKLTDFYAAQEAANTFEYYRITNVKVQIIPCTQATYNNTASYAAIVTTLQQPVNAAATTLVYACTDWTGNEIAGANVKAYNGCSVKTMSATNLKTIASYRPKPYSQAADHLVRPNDTWCSTIGSNVKWQGLQLYICNANGASTVWSSPQVMQSVNVVTTIQVEFKQPAFQNSAQVSNILTGVCGSIEEQNEEEEEPMVIRDVRSFL